MTLSIKAIIVLSRYLIRNSSLAAYAIFSCYAILDWIPYFPIPFLSFSLPFPSPLSLPSLFSSSGSRATLKSS